MMLLAWKILFIISIASILKAQRGCPSPEAILPCRCLLRGDDYQIWCSHSDLPKVLEGLKAVAQFITKPIDELILENNYLPSLPGRAFYPLHVLRLMLRYNGLERVSADWLGGLESSLMELFIVEPELRSLPEGSLLQMDSLEAVTLQTNLLKRAPLFSGLPKLRYLQLESLSLQEITPRHFKDLVLLQKLHIGFSPRLNRLEANTVRDLPNLVLVNISNCGINWMHPRAISQLPVLKELSLISNKIVDAGMVGRASRDLPLLETIRLDYNYIDVLGEAAFVDLPSLKRLYVSNNQISELHHGAFHRVPELRILGLTKNMVRRVHPESFLQHSGSGLDELSLIDNDISHVAELRSLLDALPRLIFLDMSYNNLEAIPFGALRGHPTLERLHLDYNKIHLIDREAFMAMPALRELRLRNNSLTDRLEFPFWNLPGLKGLDLGGNFFQRLNPRLLTNLPLLRKIDLTGNEINFIDPETFLVTPALEHVNLSYNVLKTLHPATFRHLLNLYEIDVSHNELMEFLPGLPRGVEYLHLGYNDISEIPLAPSPDLDLPSLRMLDLNGNKIQRIPVGSLRTLPQLRRLYLGGNLLQQLEENSLDGLSRLELLDLDANRITNIHPKALKGMLDLKEVNLKENRLDILIPDLFKSLPNLKRLIISRNQLAEILPGTLENNRKLQLIDLSENRLIDFPSSIFEMKNLRYLNLNENRIKTLDPNIISSLPALKELKLSKNFIRDLKKGSINNLFHLKTLHLDHNELEYIEPNAINNLPVLKNLKLNHNKLKELPSAAFSNLPSLQVVELQENHLFNIAPNTFTGVPHLLMLNLSSNQIGDIERSGLRTVRSLEMLDMSNNRISRVASPTLERMEWLVELKMDNNLICGIQGSGFNSMPRLRVLSLRNNKMMSFPEQAVHKLRGNIAVLDIDGNPIACGCNMLWMQGWLQESSASQGPRCIDGSLLREMRISREDCSEEEKNVEVVAPGCEAELLSAPGTNYGTSQVWEKLRTNASQIGVIGKNKLAPSPEESDYFYDEYIDYPYNESIALDSNGKADGNLKVKSDLTTVSPHFTPGDTPTIYAATKNKTKTDIPKEVVNSPSSSGFTFFGVPLPSINLNKILGGKGRMDGKTTTVSTLLTKSPVAAERKTAIMNQPFVPKPLNSINPLNPLNPLGIMPPPPSIPEVQTGGFIPLLPGTSGGFKPMVPPSNMQDRNLTDNIEPPSTTLNSLKDFIPTTTERINDTVIIRKDEGYSTPPSISVSTNPIETKTEVKAELHIIGDESRNENTSSTNPKPVPEKLFVDELTTELIKSFYDKQSTTPMNFIETASPDIVPNVTESVILTNLEPTKESNSNLEVISAAEANNLVENWSKNNPGNEKKEIGPTSLTTLMVPNQPQFKPPGRSKITKIPSPHSSISTPLLQVSEPLAHNREGKTGFDSFDAKQTEIGNQQSDDKNWYFANYNKTDIEPFIGSTDQLNNAGNKNAKFGFVLSCMIIIYL